MRLLRWVCYAAQKRNTLSCGARDCKPGLVEHIQMAVRIGDANACRQFGRLLDLAFRVAKGKVDLVELFEIAT